MQFEKCPLHKIFKKLLKLFLLKKCCACHDCCEKCLCLPKCKCCKCCCECDQPLEEQEIVEQVVEQL
jgi:hypothetical protein